MKHLIYQTECVVYSVATREQNESGETEAVVI